LAPLREVAAVSKARLIITAVVVEGRTKSEVARDYEVSRYWVQQLVRRYARGGRGSVPASLRYSFPDDVRYTE
jgi:transposase